ncbi:MAG TPA: hypothetical protein VIV11_24750 [Kofleriaceae bacterium]
MRALVILILSLTGCAALCAGESSTVVTWHGGPLQSASAIATANGATGVVWRGGQSFSYLAPGRAVVTTPLVTASNLPATAVAMAPDGRGVLVDRSLDVRTFDANGTVASVPKLADGSANATPKVVFDGTHFVVVWTQENAVWLARIAITGEVVTAAAPVGSGPADCPRAADVFATTFADGFMWIAWFGGTNDEPVVIAGRVMDGRVIDTVPIPIENMLGTGCNGSARLAIAGSGANALVGARRYDSESRTEDIVIPLRNDGVVGEPVVVPAGNLIEMPAGFAIATSTDFEAFPSSAVIGIVELDATGAEIDDYIVYGGATPVYASDESGLAIAGVINADDGDDRGHSTLGVTLVDGQQAPAMPIWTTMLTREEHTVCEPSLQ